MTEVGAEKVASLSEQSIFRATANLADEDGEMVVSLRNGMIKVPKIDIETAILETTEESVV